MLLRSLFMSACLSTHVLAADVALVDDELGQALLISNRGLCYAVLPNHVSADRDRIALAAPSPATTGAAEIFWRDVENDLALAFVEGALGDRCEIEFAALPRDLSRILQTSERGLIKSVHFNGDFFDRLGAVLIDVDDTFVSVRITGEGVDSEVMQGLSGAMLSVGGSIVGIAIDAQSSGEARFLRTDRIVPLIGSHLGGASRHPNNRNITKSDFRVTGYQGGDKAGVIALEPGSENAPWLSEWTGAPIEFEITLSNDTIVPINKLSMFTLISDTITPPRRIELQIDRGMPGSPFWTGLAAPDMSPTGVFEAPTGGTMGRRLKIRILDVWYPDRSLRIDQLALE